MKALFRYFSANNTFAWLFTIMFIAFGIKSVVTFNRDMFPDADFGTVIVTTYYMNASPEDIELNITNKIARIASIVKSIFSINSTYMFFLLYQ